MAQPATDSSANNILGEIAENLSKGKFLSEIAVRRIKNEIKKMPSRLYQDSEKRRVLSVLTDIASGTPHSSIKTEIETALKDFCNSSAAWVNITQALWLSGNVAHALELAKKCDSLSLGSKATAMKMQYLYMGGFIPEAISLSHNFVESRFAASDDTKSINSIREFADSAYTISEMLGDIELPVEIYTRYCDKVITIVNDAGYNPLGIIAEYDEIAELMVVEYYLDKPTNSSVAKVRSEINSLYRQLVNAASSDETLYTSPMVVRLYHKSEWHTANSSQGDTVNAHGISQSADHKVLSLTSSFF